MTYQAGPDRKLLVSRSRGQVHAHLALLMQTEERVDRPQSARHNRLRARIHREQRRAQMQKATSDRKLAGSLCMHKCLNTAMLIHSCSIYSPSRSSPKPPRTSKKGEEEAASADGDDHDEKPVRPVFSSGSYDKELVDMLHREILQLKPNVHWADIAGMVESVTAYPVSLL